MYTNERTDDRIQWFTEAVRCIYYYLYRPPRHTMKGRPTPSRSLKARGKEHDGRETEHERFRVYILGIIITRWLGKYFHLSLHVCITEAMVIESSAVDEGYVLKREKERERIYRVFFFFFYF